MAHDRRPPARHETWILDTKNGQTSPSNVTTGWFCNDQKHWLGAATSYPAIRSRWMIGSAVLRSSLD